MSTLYLKRANSWRNAYNPLRQLTMSRLASMLEEGERGAYAEIQWLYRTIEKRDPILRAGKRRRIAALQKFNWNIKTTDTSRLAQKQASALHNAYNTIDNLQQAISFLSLAEFRGFSHLEKHFNADNDTVHLESVPQWHWVRKGINGTWNYNAESRAGATEGQEIQFDRFIIREVMDPIDEIAAISFLRRNMSQKDWDGFIETYGIPPLFAEMPPHVPPEREAEYQAMAEAVISDARGTLPNGAKIHTVADGSRGTNPFRDHMEYQDALVVLAITGGKLTMLTESGSGTLAGNAHAETFRDLAQAEAIEISEIFQQQFDKQILAQQFPNEPILAYFQIAAEPQKNIGELLDHAVKLHQMGLTIPLAELHELTGYPLQQLITPKTLTNKKSPSWLKQIFTNLKPTNL